MKKMGLKWLCKRGLINLCKNKKCPKPPQCHVIGRCTNKCGKCPRPTYTQMEGQYCDDGRADTINDACRRGVCVGMPIAKMGQDVARNDFEDGEEEHALSEGDWGDEQDAKEELAELAPKTIPIDSVGRASAITVSPVSFESHTKRHFVNDVYHWCYRKCPPHSSCVKRTYYRRAWSTSGRSWGSSYWQSYTGWACSCRPGFYGSTSGRDMVSGFGYNSGGHGGVYEYPIFNGACFQCAPGETSDYWSNGCSKCEPGTYTPMPRTANGGGGSQQVGRMQPGCIDCWPGYVAPTSGRTTCEQCVAGRTSTRKRRSCTCRSPGTCSRPLPSTPLDGSRRQLDGSNCVAEQANRCTKDHLSKNFLLQRHDAPAVFLEESRNTQFRTRNPARNSKKTVELDCISTLRSFEMSVQLFDSREIETNATIEVAFLDYAGVVLKHFSYTNASSLMVPDLEHASKGAGLDMWGCDDAGDGHPNGRYSSFSEDGSHESRQPCVWLDKWRRLEVKWDNMCIRGVKKIRFRCTSKYCNVNWWQWLSEVEGTVAPKPVAAENGRPIDSFQGW